jgi:hypothetical protein
MGYGRTRGLGCRGAILLAAVLYGLVVMASPAFHHDLDCHLSSPKQCTACTANPAAPRAEQAPRLESALVHDFCRVVTLDERAS